MVNLAIIAVLITAPVGCVLIALTGPKLLEHNSSPEIIMEVEEEFPNGGGIDPADTSVAEMIASERRRSLRGDSDAPQQGSSPDTVAQVAEKKNSAGMQSGKTATSSKVEL